MESCLRWKEGEVGRGGVSLLVVSTRGYGETGRGMIQLGQNQEVTHNLMNSESLFSRVVESCVPDCHDSLSLCQLD